jgi:hypothetical protein
LRDEIESQAVRKDEHAGEHEHISAAEVLLAYVRWLETSAAWSHLDEGGVALPSEEVSQGSVRGVREDDESSRAPQQRKQKREHKRKHPDSLYSLSQVLARHAESAWSAYRWENARAVLETWQVGAPSPIQDWEDGFSRVVASPTSNGNAELRALGNAVVPHVAELLGRMILVEADT